MRDSNRLLAVLLPIGVLVAMLAVHGMGLSVPPPAVTVAEPIPQATEPAPTPVAQADTVASVVQADATTAPGPILGLDVSMWQGEIDWQAVAAAGYRFVIIKASEGLNYVDPCFAANWDGAKQAGLLVSAYHVFWPTLSGEKQAKHFLDTLGERKADFPLAVDVERRGASNSGAAVEAFLLIVKEADGRNPLVYTAQGVWNAAVGWAPGWHCYPLWVADYDAASPAMPAGWDDWAIWQYSNKGSVPGIEGHVDLDMFQGSEVQLIYVNGGKGDG